VSTSTNSKPPSARPTRRRFSVERKLRILAEYEAAATPEARGAVLRREGIYSSHISLWRQKRDSGGKAALDRKRGPKPDPHARELERLRRENERLIKRNAQLEKIVEVQGKMQALLQELGSKETAPPSESSRRKR
jgi:transposase